MSKKDKPKRRLQRYWTKIYIVEWCQYKRINQAELARRTGLSEGLISQIITGESNGGPESLEKIAAALKIPLGFIFDHAPRRGGDWVCRWVPDRHLPTVHAFLNSIGAQPDNDESES
jgi:transcriptional regulator with XRE-family HTH domain